jgi:hypothetical protein
LHVLVFPGIESIQTHGQILLIGERTDRFALKKYLKQSNDLQADVLSVDRQSSSSPGSST